MGSTFITCIFKTLKLYKINYHYELDLEKKYKSFIYAFWHGRQFLLVQTHKNKKAYILVSHSKDGEYIHQVLIRKGNYTVRGSSSRGGPEAFDKMVELAKQGHKIAITPDGPRGPAQTVAPGVIFLASKTQIPILPLTTSAYPNWTLNSWDNFLIPKPFAKAVVYWGKPIFIPPNINEKQFLFYKNLLKQNLDEITKKADEFVRS